MKPDLVQRNETVTLVYEVPGVVLTLRGKAIEGGAEGDTISVINEQSKRIVQGAIVGPGRVAITQRFAAGRRQQRRRSRGRRRMRANDEHGIPSVEFRAVSICHNRVHQ